MKKVLITDGVHPLLIEGLEDVGFVCDYHPKISLEKVREVIEPYTGLIINSKILVDSFLLDKAKHLKFVGRLGSGMEIVDLAYARLKKVGVYNAPEGNRNAVAEQALGMLLVLANNLLRADHEVRSKIWRREANRGFEIMGKTIGIIGFGHTGRMFASKLAGMGMNVLAYDKYKIAYTEAFPHVSNCSLEQLLIESDIISLHLPLTKETKHLVDESFFSQCKDGLILINTSRGSIVKTTDLITALKSKKLAGVCLDVFENEKPATFTAEEHRLFDELYQFENVVLSPHIAGWTYESKKKLASILLEKILKGIV